MDAVRIGCIASLLMMVTGCATHEFRLGEEATSSDVVPPGIRRLSAPESPFKVASRLSADASEFASAERGPAAVGNAQPVVKATAADPWSHATTLAGEGSGGIWKVSSQQPSPDAEQSGDRNLSSSRIEDAKTSLPAPPAPTDSNSEARISVDPLAIPIRTSSRVAQSETQSTPIDFATALTRTAGKNPQVAFARSRVNESMAQLLAAETLWLPHLRTGANFNRHDGRIQDVAGKVFETTRSAAYGGLGVRGVGAGSPTISGVSMSFDLTDAVFEPKAADSRARAFSCLSRATLNDELLETAIAYLDLLEAMQSQAIAAETVGNSEQLARITSEFARTGEGTEADANRAAASLALQRSRQIAANASVVMASSRLAQQLRLDPTALLLPQEPNVAPVALVETGVPVKELIATGLSKRPELSANRLLVDEAIQRLRREKYSVWLPSLLVGMDYGAMGGGFNDQIVDTSSRFDFDAAAYWEIRNFGFGEKAARNQARSRVDQARYRALETMDNISREIVQFHAQVEATREQIEIARSAVQSAGDAYRKDLARTREGQGLPIEVLQSMLALDAAQREYLRSTIEHNKAQFQLQRALGWPVQT